MSGELQRQHFMLPRIQLDVEALTHELHRIGAPLTDLDLHVRHRGP